MPTTNFRRRIGRTYDNEYTAFLSHSTVFLQNPESLNYMYYSISTRYY